MKRRLQLKAHQPENTKGSSEVRSTLTTWFICPSSNFGIEGSTLFLAIFLIVFNYNALKLIGF